MSGEIAALAAYWLFAATSDAGHDASIRLNYELILICDSEPGVSSGPGTDTNMQQALLYKAFSASPAFAKADPALFVELAKGASKMTLDTSQHLFHMGETARYFFWVESGAIILYRPTYNGEGKVFRTLHAGDMIAETIMFANPCHYPLSAYAEQPATLYRIAREHLLQTASRSSEFAMCLLEMLSTRVAQAVNRIDLLTIGNSAQRLVTYLLDIYMQQGSAWLTLPSSQNVLARQLNITPETFSRHLSNFKRAGYIGGRNRTLVLLDIDSLCKEVDLPLPDIDFHSKRPSANLGESLFDCCNLH